MRFAETTRMYYATRRRKSLSTCDMHYVLKCRYTSVSLLTSLSFLEIFPDGKSG